MKNETRSVGETAFREAARVALYSFYFTFLATAIIVLLRIPFATYIFDPTAYGKDSSGYVKAHYVTIVWTVVAEVIIAFLLVFITDRLSARKVLPHIQSRLPKPIKKLMDDGITHDYGIWWSLFVAAKPPNEEPLLSICLTNGTRVLGYFHACTAYDSFEKTEIAIKAGTDPMYVIDGATSTAQPINHKYIWVRGEDISYIRVKYKPDITSGGVAQKKT